MEKVKRVVTMREHPAGNESAGTPDQLECGNVTIAKGSVRELELDVDTEEGRAQLRALEKEPCVRVEEPEEHKKRVEEERKKAEAEAKKRAGGGQGGSGGKSG